jgi:hypothetical protein
VERVTDHEGAKQLLQRPAFRGEPRAGPRARLSFTREPSAVSIGAVIVPARRTVPVELAPPIGAGQGVKLHGPAPHEQSRPPISHVEAVFLSRK